MVAGQSRNFTIDVLRGISISVVLILHFHLSYSLIESPLGVVLPADAINAVARNGNYGVTMFFVISGFLITSTTIRRYGSLATVDVPGFYAFRFARIVPCLLLALVLIAGLGALGQPAFVNAAKPGWPEVSMPVAVLSVLTFWHNILMQYTWYFNYAMNVYWSLSVEEMFYLVFPFICIATRRVGITVTIWMAAIAYGPVYRYYHSDNEIYFMYAYQACFDAIAFGCCAALVARKISLKGMVGGVVRIAAAILVGATYLAGIRGHEVFGFTLVAAGTAILLVGADGERVPAPLQRNRALAGLRWLGQRSYELYLFHIIVLGLMRSIWPRGTLAYGDKAPAFAAFVGLSALAAWAVSRFYVEPLNAGLRAAFLRTRELSARQAG